MKLHLTILTLLASIISIAQTPKKDTDPAERSFNDKFPLAKNVKWKKTDDKKRLYHAAFILDDQKMAAYFDNNGKWVESEKEITVEELPERVLKAIITQYSDAKITKILQVEQNDGIIIYDTMIKSGSQKINMILSKDGYFTSR